MEDTRIPDCFKSTTRDGDYYLVARPCLASIIPGALRQVGGWSAVVTGAVYGLSFFVPAVETVASLAVRNAPAVMLAVATAFVFRVATKRWGRSYEIRNGSQIGVTYGFAGVKGIPVSSSAIPIRKVQLIDDSQGTAYRSLFGFGDISFSSTSRDDELSWDGIKNPRQVKEFIQDLQEGKVSVARRDKVEQMTLAPIEEFSVLRGRSNLEQTDEIRAVLPLDGGTRLLVSQSLGSDGPCLTIYDAKSLEILKAIRLEGCSHAPNVLAVVDDPSVVAVAIAGMVQILDLSRLEMVGDPLNLTFEAGVDYSPGHSPPPSEWPWYVKLARRIFRVPHKTYKVGSIGVFDGGKRLVMHCGEHAPAIPMDLVSWNRDSDSPSAGPITSTNLSGADPCEFAAVALTRTSCFLTAGCSGWVRTWNADTLRMKREYQVRVPEVLKYPIETPDPNAIQSLAIDQHERTLAVGTRRGVVLLVAPESGQSTLPPIPPLDDDLNQARSKYSRDNPIMGEKIAVLLLAFVSAEKILIGYGNGTVRLVRISDGQQLAKWKLGRSIDFYDQPRVAVCDDHATAILHYHGQYLGDKATRTVLRIAAESAS